MCMCLHLGINIMVLRDWNLVTTDCAQKVKLGGTLHRFSSRDAQICCGQLMQCRAQLAGKAGVSAVLVVSGVCIRDFNLTPPSSVAIQVCSAVLIPIRNGLTS